jgi:hypothetical protein
MAKGSIAENATLLGEAGELCAILTASLKNRARKLESRAASERGSTKRARITSVEFPDFSF